MAIITNWIKRLEGDDVTPLITEKKKTDRETFLQRYWHLTHDPFSTPTAEIEMHKRLFEPETAAPKRLKQRVEIAPTLSYFVEPKDISLQQLRQPTHHTISIESGQGKTQLALALEASIRGSLTPTLSVTVRLKPQDELDQLSFWQRLNRELATDLFVQLIERYHQFEANLDRATQQALRTYFHRAYRGFARRIRRQLREGEPSEATGLGTWWLIWNRPFVRYASKSVEVMSFIQLLSEPLHKERSSSSPQDLFQQGLQIAHQVGFSHVTIVLDATTDESQNEQLIGRLYELYGCLESNTAVGNSLKVLASPQINSKLILTPTITSGTLSWSIPKLHEIVSNRFRSGGSRYQSLAALSDEQVAPYIDGAIVTAANQSPRRLLQLISHLIDAHIAAGTDDPRLSIKDWQLMCRRWGNAEVTPPPPMWEVAIGRE